MKIYDFDQYTMEWWAVRLGKPSASAAKRIITSTGKKSESLNDYAIDLANDIYCGKSTGEFGGNKHTNRGAGLEPEARDYYKFIYDVDVVEVGIMVNDLNTCCSSPDGVIDNKKTLEIKCLSGVHHTKALIYTDVNNKCPTSYYAQVQMQLLVSDYDSADLFFYHPDLPCKKIEINRDEKVIQSLKDRIIETNMIKNDTLDFLRNK